MALQFFVYERRNSKVFLPKLTRMTWRLSYLPVKDGKTVAFIKVDNGPDWNLLNITNMLYFGRMWKDSGLDIFGIMSYAAQWSAYNNIEHLWSPMSKKLANEILARRRWQRKRLDCLTKLCH